MLLCKSQHQDKVDSEIHTAWPLGSPCPLKKWTDKAFSSALSAWQQFQQQLSQDQCQSRLICLPAELCCHVLLLEVIWGKYSAQRVKFLFAAEGTDLHKPVVFAQLREEITLLSSAQILHSSWCTRRGFKLLHYIQPLSTRKGFPSYLQKFDAPACELYCCGQPPVVGRAQQQSGLISLRQPSKNVYYIVNEILWWKEHVQSSS